MYFLFGLWCIRLALTPRGERLGRQGAQEGALLLDNLDDVLVLHGVGQAHPLRAVLGAGALAGDRQWGHVSLCPEQGQAWYSYYKRKVRVGVDILRGM